MSVSRRKAFQSEVIEPLQHVSTPCPYPRFSERVSPSRVLGVEGGGEGRLLPHQISNTPLLPHLPKRHSPLPLYQPIRLQRWINERRLARKQESENRKKNKEEGKRRERGRGREGEGKRRGRERKREREEKEEEKRERGRGKEKKKREREREEGERKREREEKVTFKIVRTLEKAKRQVSACKGRAMCFPALEMHIRICFPLFSERRK